MPSAPDSTLGPAPVYSTVSTFRPRVLVAEDDTGAADMLTTGLRFLGFDPHAVASGEQCLTLGLARMHDIILLDVLLPDLDGFEVCDRLRKSDVQTPVVFLSARTSVGERIHGLTLGGDDYVTKPFDLNEVAARLHALLRRSLDYTAPRRLKAGGVEIDRKSHDVWLHGVPVRLTATEFLLLRYLMEHPEEVVTKADILTNVWGHGFERDTGVVETYIYYLRRKLGDTGQTLIRTVRGVGYALRADHARQAE
ncbi:response regulator transcription factor [Kitasatospora sp. NPDC059408]|uniref:response regulator transcription factor n=1 Tax=Kitasatospora sp. NPDC059408 TaxID=3346823 RepID=UPI0036B15A69